MTDIVVTSFSAVFKVLLISGLGTWLAARGVLDAGTRRKISEIILLVLLPCLIFSKLAENATLGNLVDWMALPLGALVYIGLGIVAGTLVVRVTRPGKEWERVLVAASAFGNSGYVPLPLVAAVAVSAPLFTDDPGAADRGIAYISVYLVTMSPCLWAVAYPYLSGHSLRELDLRKVFSPPFLAAIAGLVLAGIPPLQRLFVGEGAVFGVVLDAADLVGTGVIPCALLVLGANLWDTAAGGAQRLPVRAVAGVCAARFVLLPGVATLLVLGLRRAGIIPADPMFAFVLLLEATVPPANNLVVMTQLNRRGEGGMAMLLFWGYLLAVPFLGAWVILYLWLLRT